MKMDSFEPPIILEKEESLKSKADYKREIFGDNFERMTPSKLKWLIALSGPVNDKYYGKGKTRGTRNGIRQNGPGMDPKRLPKKAERDEDDKVVGPGKEPSLPFPGLAPNGDPIKIARIAKDLVDEYFASGAKTRPPMHPADTARKRAKTPHLGLDQDGRPMYRARRPTGTYAQTGRKRRWKGVRLDTRRKASPVATSSEVERMTKMASKTKEQPKFAQPKASEKKFKPSKKPGKAKPTGTPSPEALRRAEQARRIANKGLKGTGPRSGPTRGSFKTESRNYISSELIDGKITQALYG